MVRSFGVTFCEISRVEISNIHLHAKGHNFNSVKVLFLQKNLLAFLYNMFCSQFDDNLVPIPWIKYFEESVGAFFALHLLSAITPLCLIVGEGGGGGRGVALSHY